MSLAAPLWLLLLAPLLAWIWWRRRPTLAQPLDTAALELWDPAESAAETRLQRSRPLSVAELCFVAACGLTILALARPSARLALAPRTLELWIERLPGSALPSSPPALATRLSRAGEALQQALEALPAALRPERWLWRTPGLAPFESAEFAEGFQRVLALAPHPLALASVAADRPGCLWLLLDPPPNPPRAAAWLALTGAAVPGPLSLELDPPPGSAPRLLLWNGTELAWDESPGAQGHALEIGSGLPAWLLTFARLWAAARGLKVLELDERSKSAPGPPSDWPGERIALSLRSGPSLEAAAKVQVDELQFDYDLPEAEQPEAPTLRRPEAPTGGSGEALERLTGSLYAYGTGGDAAGILGLPGELLWARGRWSEPQNDPERVALVLCRLLDRARRQPEDCVPLEQRLARPSGIDRGSPVEALKRCLRSAPEAAQGARPSAAGPQAAELPKGEPRERSLARWPAWLAALAAGLAGCLWKR